MKQFKLHLGAYILALLAGATLMIGCNKEKESEIYQNPVNLAVTKFSLKRSSTQSGLDSVYFSIDLRNRVIFNADSLPKGTKIDKLVPVITYDTEVETATITMTGGTTREGEVDYKSNPTDSIDFTGDVTLRLTAEGGISNTYRLKVNVHKQEADAMIWEELACSTLPSRLPSPKAQKTVTSSGMAISLIEESDGSYTFATSHDLASGQWNKESAAFAFTPDIRSFQATETGDFYILDTDGELYKSSDMKQWASTSEHWSSMIGVYNSGVLGLRMENGAAIFAQYPAEGIRQTEAPEDFPRADASNFVTLSNKWTSSPVAFLTGGRKADGTLSDATWAFDGKEWIKLSEGGVPALAGASIVNYYHYRKSASGASKIEYKVWLLMGGRKTDGEFNRTVYISYDNGVNWSVGSASLQLPAVIPLATGFDNVVIDSEMNANLSDAWTKLPGREKLHYELNGDIIRWDCPYIYLIGGYNADMKLYNTIWRGVLTRLTFTPII